MTRSNTRKTRRAKDSCPVVPIHALPSEILAYIFHSVLDVQPCYYDSSLTPQISMKVPEVLSRVCSRWRRIALGSPNLWSHIDLFPLLPRDNFKQLFARGKTFAARAGHFPLHIHIFGRKGLQRYARTNTANFDISDFCASVATRVGGLELLVTDWHDFGPLLLDNCFKHCVPETLRTLVTTGGFGKPYGRFSFIEASPRTAPGSKLLNVSKQRLEDLLLPINVLRLNDLYFPWTSKAYHGLVHLELTCQSSPPNIGISQLQLAQILAASPGLRYFHFGLGITNSDDIDLPTVLNDLELLSLGPLSYAEHNALLQIISPGSKPMHMWIHLNKEMLPLSPGNDFEEFARRSDIKQLTIKHSGQISLRWLYQLLAIAPTLGTLCLNGLDLDHNTSKVDTDTIPPIICRLDCLKLINCRVGMVVFQRVAEIFPVQIVELEKCRIYSGAAVRNPRGLTSTVLLASTRLVKKPTYEHPLACKSR